MNARQQIRVRILLFAAYREAVGRTAIDLNLPSSATAADAFRAVAAKHPAASRLEPYTTYAVNRNVVPADYQLQHGDEVAFLQPVSGGDDMLIEVLHGALSPDRCTEFVRRAGGGGIVTFIGCVRDVSEGKQVEHLEYEAYEPMAVESMRGIVAEAFERWPVCAAAIQHRLGTLQVGQDAVVIAVSCPHRDEAFDACRYIIDRLKEVVPIWKKERSEDGEEWVGGPTAIA